MSNLKVASEPTEIRWLARVSSLRLLQSAKSLCTSWMRDKAHRSISLKTIVLSGGWLIQYRQQDGLRSCLPSGFDVECANYFMLGKRPGVWFNRGTQRDGKCSVPPLKNFVTILPPPCNRWVILLVLTEVGRHRVFQRLAEDNHRIPT